MTKTVKKILLVAILFTTILLFKNANVFATTYQEYQEQAFNEFKNMKTQTLNLYEGEKFYALGINSTWGINIKINLKKDGILTAENKYELKARKNGTTTVGLEATFNGKTIKKTFKVNVKRTKASTKLQSKVNDVVSITQLSGKKTDVLLLNNELWNTNNKTYKISKKETGSVAKYVYSSVYHYQGPNKYTDRAMVKATLKTNNTLIAQNKKQKLTIKNVKDITSYGYLTNKNEFYLYKIDKNGKLKKTKLFKNVKKLVGDYLVVKKGKTYSISGKKICNFEIQDSDCTSASGTGLYLRSNGKLYSKEYMYTPKYQTIIGPIKQVDKNVKSLLHSNGWYKTKSGKTKQFLISEYQSKEKAKKTYYVWVKDNRASNEVKLMFDGKLKLNDVKILDKVEDINYNWNSAYKTVILITRKDGSIWKLDLEAKDKLTQVRSGKDKYKDLSTPKKVKAYKSGKSNIKVKWGKVDGSSEYTIYRSTKKNGSYKKIGTTKSTSFKDKSVKKGKTYYYKVVANHSNSKFDSAKSSYAKIKR